MANRLVVIFLAGFKPPSCLKPLYFYIMKIDDSFVCLMTRLGVLNSWIDGLWIVVGLLVQSAFVFTRRNLLVNRNKQSCQTDDIEKLYTVFGGLQVAIPLLFLLDSFMAKISLL